MKKIITGKIYFILFFFLCSCYYKGIRIKESKTIRILHPADVQLQNSKLFSESSSRYLNYNSKKEYKDFFLTNLKSELTFYNLHVISDTSISVDYVLIISSLSLTEQSNSYTVNDDKSSDNRKTYPISLCKIEAQAFLYRGEHDHLINKIDFYQSKEEKVTNQQNLFESIIGYNKDGKYYNHRSLSNNIFEDLCEKAGYKIAGRTTRLVRKNK